MSDLTLTRRIFALCDTAQYLPRLIAGFIKREATILPERVPRFPTAGRTRILNEERRHSRRLDANAEPTGIGVPQPDFARGRTAGGVDEPLG